MATKAKKNNNKNIIIGVCVAAVVVVAIVLVIVFAVRGVGGGLNDSYFVSDDTKYVLTVESDDISEENSEEYIPVKTHMVYTYSGDEITGLKIYQEYADAETAKAAFDEMKNAGEGTGDAELNGKYVVMTASSEDYEGMTASDVKNQIEFMEMLKNMDTNGTDDEEDDGEVETIKDTEE